MSIRTDVLAALALPPSRFRCLPNATPPDRIEVGKIVVMVYRTALEPAPQHGVRVNALDLWLLTPKESLAPDGADDDLDDALDQVLAAIDAAPQLTWSTAERGVWEDSAHGYKITLSIPTT